MSRNIFVTGTGTDVGKTYVTGLIVKKLAQADANAIRDYCLGNLKLEDEMEQKVTLIRDPKGKENEYFRINLKK